MKTWNLKLLLFSLLLAGADVANAQALKITDCYESARKNYPMIKQFELLERSKEFSLSNAGKAYLPQLSITGIAGYVFGGLPSFSPPGTAEEDKSDFQLIGIAQLNQTIWDGGATKSHKEIIRAATEVEKASVEVQLYALRDRVNHLFFGILLIEEQLRQLKLQQDHLQKNLNKAALYKENGLAFSSDVDEWMAELLKSQQRQSEFVHSRKAYLNMLSHLMNRPLAEDTQLEVPEIKLQNENAGQRPEMLLFASQRKLEESRSQSDRVGLMPKLGLIGAGVAFAPGLNIGPSELNSVALAGLSLNWNSGALYRNKNNKDLRALDQQKINLQEEQFLYNKALQLSQQKADIDKKSELQQRDEEIVQLRARIVKAYQLKYDNGLCSLNDLVSATDKESEARSTQALHKLEWILSLYNYSTTNGN